MQLPDFTYHRPATLAEALEILDHHPDARPLAGGQTLLNAMKLRLVTPPALVDIRHLDELRGVDTDEQGTLRVGAAVTYTELEESPMVRATQPAVAEMATLADRQVRNRGTIGGNACCADPTSNFPPLLVALGATMHIAGVAGTRTVPAEAFFSGPLQVALHPGELLTAISFAPLPADTGVGHRCLQVAADSWALARAVARVRTTPTRILDVRVVLGCVSPSPLPQPGMEQALVGRAPTAEVIEEAAAAVGAGLDPPSDVHASGEYRRAMARVQAKRAVLAALADVLQEVR